MSSCQRLKQAGAALGLSETQPMLLCPSWPALKLQGLGQGQGPDNSRRRVQCAKDPILEVRRDSWFQGVLANFITGWGWSPGGGEDWLFRKPLVQWERWHCHGRRAWPLLWEGNFPLESPRLGLSSTDSALDWDFGSHPVYLSIWSQGCPGTWYLAPRLLPTVFQRPTQWLSQQFSDALVSCCVYALQN